jgi:peptidyl-prolyl cis-trans isomerase C
VLRLLLTVTVLALLAGCSRPDPASATGQDGAASAPAATGAAGTAADRPVPPQLPDVIARVNGEPISRAEFESAVATIEANAGRPVPANERYRLLIQETRNRKMTMPSSEIESRIKEFRAQFPTEEAFTQTLGQQKLTLDQLRSNALNDMLVERLLETEVASKITVTPQQVDEFYRNNPDQFQQPERVRASHILFGFPEGADEAGRQLARTRAATVLKDLRAGKDFAEAARLHSQDGGSATNGGDLGYFQQGQMVAAFDKVAFSLQPGQMSDLVESEFGVHIIRVADRQAARTLPLDEIRPQLQQFIVEQRRQEQTEAFVNTLRAKSSIEILI